MPEITRKVREVEGIDRARFEAEIQPAGQPVVMRGLVRDWPAVMAARQSNGAVASYLKSLDVTGKPVNISVLSATQQGRFFYNDAVDGYNFMVDNRTISSLIDWLLAHENRDDVVAVYAQSLLLNAYMPAFEGRHPMPLVAQSSGGPRLWLGNRVRTQTHFDPAQNIACLVAGKRRFTLMPPGQIDNLYPGPFDFAPGGVPVSMASLEEPDFDRFPRLADALAAAQYADLEPGDAIYIPYAWWHHVRSHTGFGALINYWWNDSGADWLPPNTALYGAILALRDLPENEKQIWKHMMDRYVFGDTRAAAAHLPESGRHGFGALTPAIRARLKDFIRRTLS